MYICYNEYGEDHMKVLYRIGYDAFIYWVLMSHNRVRRKGWEWRQRDERIREEVLFIQSVEADAHRISQKQMRIM